VAAAPTPAIPLEVQVACAKRELALRRNVYPRMVAGKRMNVFKAEEEIAAMQAIVQTLEALQRPKS